MKYSMLCASVSHVLEMTPRLFHASAHPGCSITVMW